MNDDFADLPFSQACENNKRPILSVLQHHLQHGCRVLEVGSGTGQHVVFFGAELPGTSWQPSDRSDYLPIVAARVARAGLANVSAPVGLDVDHRRWPAGPFDAVYSANTAHIMGWPSVERFVTGVGGVLAPGGRFLLYGPFNYGGRFTSDSNESFDASLRQRDPASGIRDFEAVDALARAAGMDLVEDNAMPANNRLLVWRRGA
jgi:cyclopropane fatty-acyl-phospholipid synthase-like methyltransferase